MLKDVPDQTFSKRYATRIDDNQLPLDYDRRILVDSTGCCSLSYLSKRSEELLDYYIDMMKWLEPNEEVVGAAVWTDSLSLASTRAEYASTGVVAWLLGGGNDVRQTVYVQISTSLGKVKLVQFILHTCGIFSLLVVNGEGDIVHVGGATGEDPEIDYAPQINAYPSSLEFPITGAVSGQSTRTFILKNDGNANGFINRINISSPFTQHNAGIQRIAPGEFVQIEISFKPQDIGNYAGSISIDVNEEDDLVVLLTGESVSAHRMTAKGNQLVLTDGETFRLKSINWFGAETEVCTPHGLWSRNYKEILDQIKAMGFNSVRLPFSGDICNEDRYPQTGVIDGSLNDDLDGLTSIQVLDKIIGYMNEIGLYVILDHHRRIAGDGADGSPINPDYSLDKWKSSWLFMVERYAHLDYVLGADLHNEPHDLSWDEWASLAEYTGNHILKAAPHWLIFVEGVGSYGANAYWWGGELSGAADRPVKLSIDGRLVYSVHEYGQSVGDQTWLAKGNDVPAQWPFNLYGVWRKHWGFIYEQNIAPVWIGEVGGKFGIDGAGDVVLSNNAQYERQWIYHLQRYMAGYFTGDNDNYLSVNDKGISFSYWSLNPNSGDTGGILQDDWSTEQSFKLRLISMMLNNTDVPYVYGLTPLPWTEINGEAQVVLTKDGQDYAVTIKSLTDAFNESTFGVGLVHFFAQNINPNERYVGQKWIRVPGAGRTIRIADTAGNNILQTGGSDTITIGKANLPNVQLDVSGTISETDLGTKTTSSNGDHNHTVDNSHEVAGASNGFQGSGYGVGAINTSSSGDHTHTIKIGSHTHTLTDAKTSALGSGTSINIANQYVTLAAWYRSA